MANEFYVSDFQGKDDDERIVQCLKSALACDAPTVVFSGRDFEISRAIPLYDNMTVIIDNCKIRQKDLTFDNVFRGANIHLAEDNPSAPALSVDELKNVRLLGRGRAVIEGCQVNRRGYHMVLEQEQDMTGDYWGFLTYQVLIVMTNGFEMSGIEFIKTRSWAVMLDLCENFHIHDISVFSEVKNGDGIHILSGCKNGLIERISGITSDDTVAVESGFMLPCLPYKNYLFSFTPADNLYKEMTAEQLDSHDIIIRDIKSGGKMHNVILLALNDTSIYNVQVENITDICRQEPYFATVFIYTGLYGRKGILRDISVKNVYSLADTAFVSNTTVTNLLLSDLKTGKEGGRLYGTYKYI